jgi:putative ABC transport system permease protein
MRTTINPVVPWLWSALWRLQPLRALAAVAAVAIGVALGLSIHLVNQSALAEFTAAVAVASGQAQASLIPASGILDESVYPRIATDPLVAAASPVIDAELSLMRNDPSESDPSKSGPSADSGPGPASLRVLGIDPMAAALVTPGLMPEPRATSAEPDPDQGSEAKPQARSESRDEASLQGPPGASLFSSDAIFLSQAAMRALRVNPGDTIRVRAGLSTVALRVQGTVPGAAPHQVLAVMDIAVMQWRLGWAGRLSRIDLRLKPQARLEPLAQQWQTESKGAWTLATPEAANTRASMLSRAYRINLNVLALMALFTGSFIVYATLALSSAQQRPALAVLAVLGAPPRLPLQVVLGQGAILGVCGASAGMVAGIGMARLMLSIVGGDLGGGYFSASQAALVIDAPSLLLYGAFGVAAGLAGALQPAWAARRLAPARLLGADAAQAEKGDRRFSGLGLRAAVCAAGAAAGLALCELPPIGGMPLAAYGAIAVWLLAAIALVPVWLAAIAHGLARAEGLFARYPPAWLAAQRLAGRDRGFSTAMAAVVVSVALSSAMTVMVGSFRQSVQDWLGGVLPADLYARAGTVGAAGAIGAQALQALADIPGVKSAQLLRIRELSLSPAQPSVVLIARTVDRSDPGKSLPLVGPARPVPAGAVPVWISEAMVDLYGWHPGQTVDLPVALPVAAPARTDPATHEAGVSQSTVEVFVAGVWRDYARQFGAIVIDHEDYRRTACDESATDLAVWIDADQSPESVLARISERVPQLARLSWKSARQIQALSMAIFDRSFALTYALEAIALVVGLFGVTTTFAAQALARTREFGLLRHLGLGPRGVAAQLALESAVLLSLAAAWGLCVGAAIAWVLTARVNPQSFHWTMALHWPLGALASGALAVVALGTTAALAAARHAMGPAPVQALRQDW